MSVMSARVMRAGLGRPVRLTTVGFCQRQGIDVGAQQDPSSGTPAAEHADNARLANACSHAEAEFGEAVSDDACRPVLLVRKLRVTMEVTPKLDKALPLLGGQHAEFNPDVASAHAPVR